MLRLNGTEIITERFPNNETKVKDFENAIRYDGPNILEFKYFTDEDLIALMFVKLRINEFQVPCTLFIWYMPYSRMDRKIEGNLFTLQDICYFINWLDFEKVVVMEPHSSRTMIMLERANPVFPIKDWLTTVLKEVGFSDEKDHIVFPDKKIAARYADSGCSNICIFEKNRNPETGTIKNMYLKEGTINPGSKCIIIGDLCSKGETFACAGNILKSLGASDIYVIVSHCEKTIFDGELLSNGSPIKAVYTSTSIMSEQHPNIKYMDVDVIGCVNQ